MLTHMLACAQTYVWTRTRTWGPPYARQQPRAPPAASLTHKYHTCTAALCTLARHPLALPYTAACVHTQEVAKMCTHAGVHTPTSWFHPGHVQGVHRPARARRFACRSLPCPAVLKSWSSSWLPLGPLVPAVPSHGDLSATCPRAARCLPVPPSPTPAAARSPVGAAERLVPASCARQGGSPGGARSCSFAAKGWGDVQAGVEASCVP